MAAEEAINPEEAANTVILDEAGVKNLRLQTVMLEERDFASTIFAIGRVEEIPGNQYSVSACITEQRVAEIAPGTRAHIRFPALGGEPIIAELYEGVRVDDLVVRIPGKWRENPERLILLRRSMRAGLDIGFYPMARNRFSFILNYRLSRSFVVPQQLPSGIRHGSPH